MLLAAQDEETGVGMTDRQVRDEVMTLFLAGHETTANALAWTWYLLAQHPTIQETLHAEVDAVLQGRPAGFDDLARLGYARQVFSEAMRIYPPAWVIGREARQDVALGGVLLERGTTVFVSPYLLHRDPRFWARPERFEPDRFAPEAKAQRHKFSYLPFGSGRRGCIGEQFAWAEGVLLLATIAQAWTMRPAMDRTPAVFPSITLRPRHPLPVQARRRHPRAYEQAA
jgi:cytochrome P450